MGARILFPTSGACSTVFVDAHVLVCQLGGGGARLAGCSEAVVCAAAGETSVQGSILFFIITGS